MTDVASQRQKLDEISAVPAKDILKNKARVCPPLSAICEIMDNVFDNFEETGSKRDLAISFLIKTSDGGEISIAENSGGVSKAKLEPLVRLGVAYHSNQRSIGTWGEGFKVAAFSLGSRVEVFTHFPDETPVVVSFGDDWLADPAWTVPVYAAGREAPPSGSTVFKIQNLHRKIEWTDVMRELSVIYGHKIQGIVDAHRKVRLTFDIDGRQTQLQHRPLASPNELRKRLAYPPEFSPRQFTATWKAEFGSVKCRLIIGLTPRHSGETSGVYMYGNGRMFARALRTRAVGYGDGGNAMLRDHPTCWRIHAYAFFEADNPADIPWQAPLKDGVSENHVITTKFREMFKEAVTPYSRLAKMARASELVPYTIEWNELGDEERAEVLFRNKSPQVIAQVKSLPDEIQEFTPPDDLETVRIDGMGGEELIRKIDEHAKYLRPIISRRDAGGPLLEMDVLRAMNPAAFEREQPIRQPKIIAAPNGQKQRIKVTFDIETSKIEFLKKHFQTSSDTEAARAAVSFAHSELRSPGKNRATKK